MAKNTVTENPSRSLFLNVVVLTVFVSLMFGFIWYLNTSTPDIKRLTLERLAEEFSTSVLNAHWQWQAEGRPEIVMSVTYANSLGEDKKLVETGRQPVFMNHLGWPKAAPSSAGCEKIWNMVLNVPMEIDGFKVLADYFDGEKSTGNSIDSFCRYRLSTGLYFEYKVNIGQVLKVSS